MESPTLSSVILYGVGVSNVIIGYFIARTFSLYDNRLKEISNELRDIGDRIDDERCTRLECERACEHKREKIRDDYLREIERRRGSNYEC